MSQAVSSMNKAELVDAILEEGPDDEYEREELEDSSEYSNDDRREILSGLRSGDEKNEEGGSLKKAQDKGYPVVDGQQVLEILPDKETPDRYHVRMQDGSSRHVSKELFE